MKLKESATVRYAYGVATALLIGGTAFSVAVGPVGAQVAQNAPARIAPPGGAPMSFADLAERLQPAVVNISTKQRVPVRRQVDPIEEFFRRFGAPGAPEEAPGQGTGPRTRETGSLGSGFIISADGYIVTNNHLIRSASGNGVVDEITVTLTNRREYPARVIGRDELSDLALLKIEGSNLPFVRWGDSTRARVGDWVLAIGNPYSLGGTVTAGIISALHRGITGVGAYDRYIQTDASINMGNSGGPMFDLNGNVIGINTALISPTGANVGIGLAIPTELAKPVIDSLRRGERPQRGYLGVGLQELGEDVAAALGLPKERGELVLRVQPDTPASKAGIQQGDVIVRVNGQDVTPQETVSFMIANTAVGARIPLEIIRNGRRQTVTVQVEQRPPEGVAQLQGDNDNVLDQDATPNESDNITLGMVLRNLTPQIAQQLQLPQGSRGMFVFGVDPNSDAAEKGIQRGDLLISVDRGAVATAADVQAAVETARRAGRDTVLVLIRRGENQRFFGVKIAE